MKDNGYTHVKKCHPKGLTSEKFDPIWKLLPLENCPDGKMPRPRKNYSLRKLSIGKNVTLGELPSGKFPFAECYLFFTIWARKLIAKKYFLEFIVVCKLTQTQDCKKPPGSYVSMFVPCISSEQRWLDLA